MAEQNIKWTVDGEFAGEQKNVKIENMQKKIEMTILHYLALRKQQKQGLFLRLNLLQQICM